MLDYSIGKRCQYSICKQQDFLPFNCQLCNGNFCMDHRTPEQHECNKAASQRKAIVCPICNKGISYSSTKDENMVWEEHFINECTQQQTQKQTCPICKIKITQINSVKCSQCGIICCLKHRQHDDHIQINNQQPIQQPFIQKNQNITQQKNDSQNKQQQQQKQIEQTGQEICTICGKKFPYILNLIRHSEMEHQQ